VEGGAPAGAQQQHCPACRAIYRVGYPRCPTDGEPLVESATDPLVGTTLGSYAVEAYLGEGAMGRVYRAHHTHLEHKPLAIKVLFGDLSTTLEMRLRFTQEARAASRLDHPNVVRVSDFGRSDAGLMYLVMELVEGGSLGDAIERGGALPVPRALAIARKICLGLAHAHDRGLVHRDLKPDNILLDADDAPRIVDFGLAITNSDDGPGGSARLTRVGFALGTPIYAAPEQAFGEEVDQRADLFSLGVTLYEMLAGVPPFDGDSHEVIARNARDEFPAIGGRTGVLIPSDVEAIVRRLMRRSPADRFATATEVIAAIDATLSPAVVVELPSPPPRARRGRWVAAAGGLGAGAIAIAYLLGTDDIARDPRVATIEIATPADAAVAPIAPPIPDVDAAMSTRPVPPPEPARATEAPEPSTVRARPPRSASSRAPLAVPADAGADEPVEATTIDASAPLPPPTELPPPPRVAPPPIAPAPPPAPRLLLGARVVIDRIDVSGPLSDNDVRRGLDRITPALATCYRDVARAASSSPRATVKARFAIDGSRRAHDVATTGWTELASCARGVLGGVRSTVAPDVGDATVRITIEFHPETP